MKVNTIIIDERVCAALFPLDMSLTIARGIVIPAEAPTP
jgi:hypothetical protein